jgi:hypothetical protein
MKPVRLYCEDLKLDYNIEAYYHSDVLVNAGYYRLRIGYSFEERYHHYPGKHDAWCRENYFNDYYICEESVFFTNKEIAVLMKLSVE